VHIKTVRMKAGFSGSRTGEKKKFFRLRGSENGGTRGMPSKTWSRIGNVERRQRERGEAKVALDGEKYEGNGGRELKETKIAWHWEEKKISWWGILPR